MITIMSERGRPPLARPENCRISVRRLRAKSWRGARCDSGSSDADRLYIERKLANGKMRIWQDVQTKVRVFVLANDLSGLGIDTFLEFMDVIHK